MTAYIPHMAISSQRGRGAAIAVAVAVVAGLAAAGCSRSLGEYQTRASVPTNGAPIALGSAAPVLPSEVGPETTGSVPPVALVPEQGAGVANLGAEAARLPAEPQAAADDAHNKRILTPEEKARIIAELEALARQQSGR